MQGIGAFCSIGANERFFLGRSWKSGYGFMSGGWVT